MGGWEKPRASTAGPECPCTLQLGVPRMPGPDPCLPGPFLRLCLQQAPWRNEGPSPPGQRIGMLTTPWKKSDCSKLNVPLLVMQPIVYEGIHLGSSTLHPTGLGGPKELT